MSDAYLDYINGEVVRAEADLASFRARSLTVLTASTAVITLITATITFGSSKSESEAGIPDLAIVLLACSIACFLFATILALLINDKTTVKRVRASSLVELTTGEGWASDTNQHERYVANTLAKVLGSLHDAIEAAATRLNHAIKLIILGLFLAGVGGIVAAAFS